MSNTESRNDHVPQSVPSSANSMGGLNALTSVKASEGHSVEKIPLQATVPLRVISQTSTDTDITADFIHAASGLNFGQVIKDEHFSLFEAVGALEIGDSKMDSGFLAEGETLEDDYDFARSLSSGEVIWLMDELICHEVAWLTGYPLSQTLFTSLYIDHLLWPEPKTIKDAQLSVHLESKQEDPLLNQVFRSYCLALVKSCDLVHTMVKGQHYYEEEDFASQLFHRELLHRFPCEDICPLLDQALSWLENAEFESNIKEALSRRLNCRKLLLRTLQRNTLHQQANETEIASCVQLLLEIKNSLRLGTPIPSSFSLKIQRGLASNVPPRPMVTVGSDQAFTYFEKFFMDSAAVFEILCAEGSGELWTAYWTFFSQRPQPSVYIRTLAQSFLDENEKVVGKFTLKDFVFDNLRRLVLPASPLLDPSNDHVEAPNDKRFQVAKRLNDFVTMCGQSYLNVFRTTCLNRCRIRRTLCHAVTEWDQLQAEAEEYDGALQIVTGERPRAYPPGMPLTYAYPLSSWIYHYKLCQMEIIIQMGFELDVYAPDELNQMYWYLSHISAVHLSHLDRISFFVEKTAERTSGVTPTLATAMAGGEAHVEGCLHTLFRHFSQLKATEAFSGALHRLYTVLNRHGLLLQPQRPYASGKLRYELRMRPFLCLSIPEPLSFGEFHDATSLQHLPDFEILEEASYLVSVAKKLWDDVMKAKWKSEPMKGRTQQIHTANASIDVRKATSIEVEWTRNMRGILKSCIAASITIATLKKRITNTSSRSHSQTIQQLKVDMPKPGDRDYWHEWWLIPRISE